MGLEHDRQTIAWPADRDQVKMRVLIQVTDEQLRNAIANGISKCLSIYKIISTLQDDNAAITRVAETDI